MSHLYTSHEMCLLSCLYFVAPLLARLARLVKRWWQAPSVALGARGIRECWTLSAAVRESRGSEEGQEAHGQRRQMSSITRHFSSLLL